MPVQCAIGGTPRAKCCARCSWSDARTLIANAPDSRISSSSAAWRPRATATSGGSIESEPKESTVSPAASPETSTVTTPTGAGISRNRARSSSPGTGRILRARLLVAALRVREDRTLFLVRERVERWVERSWRGTLPEEDRGHAGTHHGRAVLG